MDILFVIFRNILNATLYGILRNRRHISQLHEPRRTYIYTNEYTETSVKYVQSILKTQMFNGNYFSEQNFYETV